MEPQEIQKALSDLLSQGKKITFKWDCGGDEAFIYTFVDGEKQDIGEELAEELEVYLLNLLGLPSAGEFTMEGEGRLVVKEDKLVIQYQSTLLGYEGDDGWVEVNQKEDEYSGETNVFE